MSDKYTMKQHDLEPGFEVRLLDGTTPISLLSAVSVLFVMKSRKAIKASGEMTVADQNVNASVGIVRYDWVLGDTDTAGSYSAEIQVTWPTQRPQTFPANRYITVDIQKDLGPGRVVVGVIVTNDGGGLVFVGAKTTEGVA